MYYLTEEMACSVGCGVGLMFLKEADTARVFLFCYACGSAYRGQPRQFTEHLTSVKEFAPNGIAFPDREEIVQASLDWAIAIESDNASYLDDLWELLAYTAIKRGQYQQAIDITTKVISTWHGPPAEARAMQAEAIRLLAGAAKR
jgi:hypothetical protein